MWLGCQTEGLKRNQNIFLGGSEMNYFLKLWDVVESFGPRIFFKYYKILNTWPIILNFWLWFCQFKIGSLQLKKNCWNFLLKFLFWAIETNYIMVNTTTPTPRFGESTNFCKFFYLFPDAESFNHKELWTLNQFWRSRELDHSQDRELKRRSSFCPKHYDDETRKQ